MKTKMKISLAILASFSMCGQVFAAAITTNVGATTTIVAAPSFGTVTNPAFGTITYSGTSQIAQVNTNGTSGGTVNSETGQTAGNVTVGYGANSFNSLVVTPNSSGAFTMTTGTGDVPGKVISGAIGIVLTASAGATSGSQSVTCDATQTTCPISIGATTGAIANSQIAGLYTTAGTNGSVAVLTLTYS